MKKKLKNILEYIGDFVLLLLFYIRYVSNRCVKFPLKGGNLKSISVLGNGPSLKAFIETHNVLDKDAICVNFSPLTDAFYVIRPKYLVLIDPEFYNVSNESVMSLSEAIRTKVTWEVTIITTKAHLQKAASLYGGKNIRFESLPQIPFEPRTKRFIEYRNRMFRKGITMPSAQNVAIAAIFMAINSGYKQVNLYGLEHSWLKDTYVSENNIPCLKDEHYYGTQDVPWAFNSDGTPWKLYQLMEALGLVFKGYIDLQVYADYLGDVKIINKTKGSWIDAFERG